MREREKQEAVACFATIIKITLKQFIINLSQPSAVELESALRQWQKSDSAFTTRMTPRKSCKSGHQRAIELSAK
jgi:hypothetical protein